MKVYALISIKGLHSIEFSIQDAEQKFEELLSQQQLAAIHPLYAYDLDQAYALVKCRLKILGIVPE